MIQITILQARELEMLLAPDINRQLVFREADWEKWKKNHPNADPNTPWGTCWTVKYPDFCNQQLAVQQLSKKRRENRLRLELAAMSWCGGVFSVSLCPYLLTAQQTATAPKDAPWL